MKLSTAAWSSLLGFGALTTAIPAPYSASNGRYGDYQDGSNGQLASSKPPGSRTNQAYTNSNAQNQDMAPVEDSKPRSNEDEDISVPTYSNSRGSTAGRYQGQGETYQSDNLQPQNEVYGSTQDDRNPAPEYIPAESDQSQNAYAQTKPQSQSNEYDSVRDDSYPTPDYSEVENEDELYAYPETQSPQTQNDAYDRTATNEEFDFQDSSNGDGVMDSQQDLPTEPQDSRAAQENSEFVDYATSTMRTVASMTGQKPAATHHSKSSLHSSTLPSPTITMLPSMEQPSPTPPTSTIPPITTPDPTPPTSVVPPVVEPSPPPPSPVVPPVVEPSPPPAPASTTPAPQPTPAQTEDIEDEDEKKNSRGARGNPASGGHGGDRGPMPGRGRGIIRKREY